MKTHGNTKEPTRERITHADLSQFHGDDVRYKTMNRRVIYSPGVKFLAEHAGAYWLIDAISSYYTGRQTSYPDPRLESLQFWKLVVNEDCSATLTSRADSDAPPYVIQDIPLTDFPLSSVDVWAGFDGMRWTLYLPSEH